MLLNKKAADAYASLGSKVLDRWTLWSCGLVVSNQDRMAKMSGRMMLKLIPKFWLKPNRLKGLKLLIDPKDWSQMVIFEEMFLHASYDLRKVPFEPATVLDCGAHIGLFSLLAKSTFPGANIVAYEPNPNNATLIRHQIAKNALSIDFKELALSTESRELEFAAINSHGGRLKGHETDGITGDTAPTYRVRSIDLAAELGRLRPKSVLIKMDIEGEEQNVLPAIVPLLPEDTAIFFETHAGESGWANICRLLESRGFRVEKLNARGLYYDGFACRTGAQLTACPDGLARK